jgi:hypothetical protein
MDAVTVDNRKVAFGCNGKSSGKQVRVVRLHIDIVYSLYRTTPSNSDT